METSFVVPAGNRALDAAKEGVRQALTRFPDVDPDLPDIVEFTLLLGDRRRTA